MTTPRDPIEAPATEQQRLNDEYMRGYNAASRFMDGLLAIERAAARDEGRREAVRRIRAEISKGLQGDVLAALDDLVGLNASESAPTCRHDAKWIADFTDWVIRAHEQRRDASESGQPSEARDE